MPYITKDAREALERIDKFRMFDGIPVTGAPSANPGELNYVLTRIILEYLELHGRSYATMNEIVGALEQVKDEFQRRVIHPYEQEKCEEHGDVY